MTTHFMFKPATSEDILFLPAERCKVKGKTSPAGTFTYEIECDGELYPVAVNAVIHAVEIGRMDPHGMVPMIELMIQAQQERAAKHAAIQFPGGRA